MRIAHLSVAVSLCLAGSEHATAQVPDQGDGLYTTAQAEVGAVLYEDQCSSCHGELAAFFPEMAALLADHTFRARWTSRPLGELFTLIQDEMPQDAPGTLSREETTNLLAYILRGNRLPAGTTPLSDDVDRLHQVIPFAP